MDGLFSIVRHAPRKVVEQVCSHLLILRNGNVLAYGAKEKIHAGIEHSSLESTFVHLVEEVDTDKVCREIIGAMEGGCTCSLIESSRQSCGKPQKPFTLLFRLSINRVLHGISGDSPEGELDLSFGVILSLLALPGAFYSILLLENIRRCSNGCRVGTRMTRSQPHFRMNTS